MIKINGLLVSSFKFSGGEVNPSLPNGLKQPFNITAWLQSSDDIMTLLMVHDAIIRQYGDFSDIHLTVPYMPYGRQDRVCNTGEALSLEVMQDLLSRFTSVRSFDLHNPIAGRSNLIEDINMKDFISPEDFSPLSSPIIVAPDKGATGKITTYAQSHNHSWIQGIKDRDPSTGALSGFGVDLRHRDSIEDRDILIMDDICDGGGTFLGLATELRKLNPKSISLYVTHGIFSKGIDTLLDTFDHLFTTETFLTPYTNDPRINLIKGIV